MLNGFGDCHDTIINDGHLEMAIEQLDRFLFVIILEKPDSYRLFEQYYDIKHSAYTPKKLNDSIDFLQFKEDFIKENEYDYELYKYAIQKHHVIS